MIDVAAARFSGVCPRVEDAQENTPALAEKHPQMYRNEATYLPAGLSVAAEITMRQPVSRGSKRSHKTWKMLTESDNSNTHRNRNVPASLLGTVAVPCCGKAAQSSCKIRWCGEDKGDSSRSKVKAFDDGGVKVVEAISSMICNEHDDLKSC